MTTRRRPMQKIIEDLVEHFGHTEAFERAIEQRSEFHLRIENEPYMPLTIEVTYEGFVAIAHTYTQNGDVMRDPEIVFDPAHWRGVEITQDPVGVYRRMKPGTYSPGVESLAKMWAQNIRHQGFANGTATSLTHGKITA